MFSPALALGVGNIYLSAEKKCSRTVRFQTTTTTTISAAATAEAIHQRFGNGSCPVEREMYRNERRMIANWRWLSESIIMCRT